MQPIISITNLTKVYKLKRGGRKTAVDSLTFEVRPGEIFGFLGPNGAGKTTTIKMLLGFIQPTAGSAEISGISVENPQARINVGYLPEQPYFYKFMTPREIVAMHSSLAGVPRQDRRTQIEQVIELVGLGELASTPISKLSKGQVQRVGLAQSLVGNPQVLILDEPASGLDPLGRRQIRDLLISQRETGKTIFLSSHLLSEIETVCDRVAVLAKGKLMAIGTPEEIKQGGTRTTVTTTELTPEIMSEIKAAGGTTHRIEGETVITINTDEVFTVIDSLRKAGLPLLAVTPEQESLEEAFLRLAA
ncbi:MAG TPA: ABC transporter ATP-binding protein [Armatimonadota bacterium]|nr:ABC transporter ATP-binding protein [Armatimonadota bacterium]